MNFKVLSFFLQKGNMVTSLETVCKTKVLTISYPSLLYVSNCTTRVRSTVKSQRGVIFITLYHSGRREGRRGREGRNRQNCCADKKKENTHWLIILGHCAKRYLVTSKSLQGWYHCRLIGAFL